MNQQTHLLICLLSLILFVVGTSSKQNNDQNNIDTNTDHSNEQFHDENRVSSNKEQHIIENEQWPYGIIPYEIADNIASGHSALIEKMMRKMEKLMSVKGQQCVVFRRKVNSDSKFINIFNGPDCYSPIGSWGDYMGARKVSLHHSSIGTCMLPETVLYQLAHVLGYSNENYGQDSFVQVDSENTKSDHPNLGHVSFVKAPYYRGSIMRHNDANSPQAYRLTSDEISKLQQLYGCIPQANSGKRLHKSRSFSDDTTTTTAAGETTTTTAAVGETTTTTAAAGETTTTTAAAVETTTTTAAAVETTTTTAAAGGTTTTTAAAGGTTTTTAAAGGTTTTTAAAGQTTTTTAAAGGTTTTTTVASGNTTTTVASGNTTRTTAPASTTARPGTTTSSTADFYPKVLLYVLVLVISRMF